MDWPTILVASVIAVIFAAIVITGIRNKQKGKHSCSCGGNCGACGICGDSSESSQDGCCHK